jgi:hypothetical protein
MSWTSETNIKGPVGPQGPQGPVGPQGPAGASGAGTGNVTGPAGAVADRIAVYNGSTGTVIKDGGKLISDLTSASGIAITPAGNIASTDVQAALNELDNEKVAKAGDVMTGALTLPADPTQALQASTKQYVDNSVRAPATAVPIVESGSGAVGTSLKYAREDHVHPLTGAGSGNVVGPASAVLNRIAVYGDTTGKLIADGGTLISALQPTNQAVRYDAVQSLTAPQKLQARVNIATHLRGVLFDLTLSTIGSSTSFTVNSGEAADSTGADLMVLGAALTKTTGAWVVGAGGGALDTGTIATATWYHVFLIKRPDTGGVDVLISLSPTAPTLPANYTLFRRIGSMLTNASSQWTSFTQLGDDFMWSVPPTDLNTSTFNGSATFFPLSVPSGVQVGASIRGNFANNTVATFLLLTSPGEASAAAGGATGYTTLIAQVSGVSVGYGPITIRTNTSGQIRATATTASTTLRIATIGWADRRGRDS